MMYLLVWLFGIIYLFPTFVAFYNKNNQHKTWVVVINLLLGWTIIGWFFALFKAFSYFGNAPIIKTGLPAFNIQNSKVVILGTFPGTLSLHKRQYYADNSNKFWGLLGLNQNDMDGLKKLNIGLWDVIKSCERDGSIDKNITNAKYNDLSVLKGKTIFFNGKQAYTYFVSALKEQKLNLKVSNKHVLPSSSAALPIKSETRKKQWKKVILATK